MRRIVVFSLVVTALCTLAQPSRAQSSQVVAFVNVNVLPMDRERVLKNQTVIVRDGRIAELGAASKIKVPQDALVVEGKGKYLMPGLAEMHGHLPTPQMSEQVAHALLFLYAANGVTTVRGMLGAPNQLALRDKAARGEIFAPTLYLAAPALSGNSVQDAATARRLVREYKQAGYELLKIQEGLKPEVYDAIADEAKKAGIPFAGHVPDQVGLERAIRAGQASVDHFDNYIDALEADNSPVRNASPQERAQKLPLYLDEKKLPALVKLAREMKTWNVPTMFLWQTFYGPSSVESLRQMPELKYVPAQMVNSWAQQRANLIKNNNPEAGRRVIEMRDKILMATVNGGGFVMLGSDAPQVFNVPGFSLHREMQAMAKAGMKPYQIYETGTRNPAIYFKTPQEFGTVAVGRRADLVLLNENPLTDVSKMANRAGVMVRGRWRPQGEIQRRLDEIAAAFAQPAQ